MLRPTADRPVIDADAPVRQVSGPRALYVRAADPERPLPGGSLVARLRAHLATSAGTEGSSPADPPADSLAEWRRRASAWSAEEADRFRAVLDSVRDDTAGRDVLVRRAALGCAPLGLVSGGWLQWLSAPGNAEDAVVMRVLALYASDVGVGHPGASRGGAYLALLRRLLLSEHAVPAERMAFDARVADEAFGLPAVLLAMSRRPDEFQLEILGADLCLRTVGLLPALAVVRAVHPDGPDWPAIDPGSARYPGEPADAGRALDAVHAAVAAGGDGADGRACAGFGWALAALRRWSGALLAELDAARDPVFDMVELLRLRAHEGAVYHQHFRLHDRPLSEWLKDSQTDPSGLLEVLAESRLVQPGRSTASPLVRGLVSERGPMFRVFAPEDLAVIGRWIDSLPARQVGADEPAARPVTRTGGTGLPGLDGSDLAGTALDAPVDVEAVEAEPVPGDAPPADLRAAYHRLQRRTDTPALRHWARDYVYGWLARAAHRLDEAEHQLPRRWGPEGLRPWLSAMHDRAGQEFEASSESPLPSREALVDSTVQLAPLTLIDGGWLQGFTDYAHASSEVGHFLFETYWDELGNGELVLNHPLIYRAVLREMGVELPPTASREFAQWSGFRDASFELPVYWLSIGRFPRTFLPEVLGLNLAMELSGVGGTYRRARIALKTYGFSTRFVDIHNTIDNVASGHSAWAADAIDTYMSMLPAAQGSDARAEVWQRIRVGYRSLNPPTGTRARRAGRRAQRASGR